MRNSRCTIYVECRIINFNIAKDQHHRAAIASVGIWSKSDALHYFSFAFYCEARIDYLTRVINIKYDTTGEMCVKWFLFYGRRLRPRARAHLSLEIEYLSDPIVHTFGETYTYVSVIKIEIILRIIFCYTLPISYKIA